MVVGDVLKLGAEDSPIRIPDGFEGDLIHIKVVDVGCISPVGTRSQLFAYTPSAVCSHLIEDVAAKFQMKLGSFQLIYQELGGYFVDITKSKAEELLTKCNISPSRKKEYPVSLFAVKNKPKPKTVCLEELRSNGTDNDFSDDALLPRTREREFVGIKNSNMNCYMASALQCLFLTPEFRNLVYIHESQGTSVCLGVQKFLLRLQMSGREAIEAAGLMRLLGLNYRDYSVQHDVEEFFTVLMSAVSEELERTKLDGLVDTLYNGYEMGFLKCLACKAERPLPKDTFLIYRLGISPSGSGSDGEGLGTLEGALAASSEPELLDGSNQAICDHCNGQRTDHLKRLAITKLPSILNIQLKRFDNTGTICRKVISRVEFPVVLDMNPFVEKSSGENNSSSGDKNLEVLRPPSGSKVREEHSRVFVKLNGNTTTTASPTLGFDSSRAEIAESLKVLRDKGGSDVYELFSVFVHSGSLTMGHYYAYIRDQETYHWYRFDDANVRRASAADISSTFGGNEENKDDPTAYMLGYRRFSESPILPFLSSELPPQIKALWEEMKENDEAANIVEQIEKTTLTLPVSYRPNKNSLDVQTTEKSFPKEFTTNQIALELSKTFLNGLGSPIAVRIVRFDVDLGIIENSWDGSQYMSRNLKIPTPISNNPSVLLEVLWGEGEEFQEYAQDDFVFKSSLLNVESGKIEAVGEFHAPKKSNVGSLRALIGKKWGLEEKGLKLGIKLEEHETASLLNEDATLLTTIGLQRVNTLSVSALKEDASESGWLELVSEFFHKKDFSLEVTKPRESQGINVSPLESLDNVSISINLEENDGKNKQTVVTLSTDQMTAQSSELIRLRINIDERLGLKVISLAIGQVLGDSVSQEQLAFFVAKEEDDEDEMTDYAQSLIQSVEGGVFKLRFCPRVDLSKGEGRVEAFYLNLSDLSGSGCYLGSVVLSPEMELEATKSSCLSQLHSDKLKGVSPKAIRLRKKGFSGDKPSKIFRVGGQDTDVGTVSPEWLRKIHKAHIYVQDLGAAEETPLGKDEYPMIIRHWEPSCWLLHPPVELIVFHDYSEQAIDVIASALHKALGNLAIEDMEIARVDALSFPFNMNPLAIQAMEWLPVTQPPTKGLTLCYDELVLFVRNKNEVCKPWTAEEEKIFLKDCDLEMTSMPKREQSLRINLNPSISVDS